MMPCTRAAFVAAWAVAASAGPSLAADVVRTLADDGRFDTFAAALQLAAPEGATPVEGPLTVFAPSDEAFERLPEATRAALLSPENDDAMEAVLALHLVPGGPHRSTDLPVEMTTVSGERLAVTYTRGALTLRVGEEEATTDPEAVLRARAANEARVVSGDIAADGALIHVIDAVLLPPNLGSLDEPDDAAPDEAAGDAPPLEAAGDTSPAQATSDASANTFVADIAASDGDGGASGIGQRLDDAAAVGPGSSASPNVTILPPEPEPAPPPEAGDVVTLPAEEVEVVMAEPDPEPVQTAPAPEALDEGAASAGAQPALPEPDEAIELTRPVVSVSDLIGRSVRDGEGEAVGEVEDLLISLATARVETIVIEMEDGFLGLFGSTSNVNVSEIAIDPLDGALVVDRDALKSEDD
ncbi:fasciclin domain-containing protein [Acuticoccus sp.]|uniref:fasciclin domain-containing protein n=1 Tax=Acuticoccus sp. TaxID=1904378 RepID=UPI003B516046